MSNSHVHIVVVTDPKSDIWRSKGLLLVKKWSKCALHIDNQQRYPYKIMLYYCTTKSHISVHFIPYQLFWSYMYRSFWDKCPEWPQSDLEHYEVKDTPNMCWYSLSVTNFSQFCYSAKCFGVRGHFKVSALYNAKVNKSTARSNTPHIGVTNVCEIQNFSLTCSMPTIFELESILRPVDCMNPFFFT